MRFCCHAGLTALLFLASASAQELRTWTSASGKTLEAAFVENRFGQVVLQKAGGEKIKINLNQLSSADQIYVGSHQKPGSAPAAAPAAASGEKPVPPELEELFGKRLTNAKGKRVSTGELTGKTIGIYFSASWCPPCRAFTPQLVAAYNQLQAEGKPFEVVLVSFDQNEAGMKAYMKDHEMPWLAVPYGSKPVEKLKKTFGVSGIPALAIVGPSGQTISANARGEVLQKGAKAFDRWQVPAVP